MPELPMRLVYSVRNAEDVIFADELLEDALVTFTREAPQGWSGATGRIDGSLLAQTGSSPGSRSSAARTASWRRPRSWCWKPDSSRRRFERSATARRARSDYAGT
jgi:hypothetical protein